MWSYKTHIDGGPFMCYRLILYQAFIQTYPTMATYYLALAYNQASGQARTRIMGGQGTRKMSFAFLLFAGYFSMYCVNLWLQWSYWLRLGNGRTREAFDAASLTRTLTGGTARRRRGTEVETRRRRAGSEPPYC